MFIPESKKPCLAENQRGEDSIEKGLTFNIFLYSSVFVAVTLRKKIYVFCPSVLKYSHHNLKI